MRSSSADMRRGVNERLTRVRSSSCRAVGLPLQRGREDVGEATQRVEVVLLVVIERRFVAQAPPYRVRIGVDPDVVGVVVGGGIDGAHRWTASCNPLPYVCNIRSA